MFNLLFVNFPLLYPTPPTALGASTPSLAGNGGNTGNSGNAGRTSWQC